MTRRSHRRKRRHAEATIQLNMAAMLDMAFQLLAFFILTFKASPIEAQISLRLPDAPQATQSSSVQIESSPQDVMDDFGFPLPIELHSRPNGELEKIMLGSRVIESADPAEMLRMFRQEMTVLFEKPIFESIVVRVEKDLHYDSLMKVVDVCTKQKTKDGSQMSKITILPLK
jgi:biopolymer transport protein ExbD